VPGQGWQRGAGVGVVVKDEPFPQGHKEGRGGTASTNAKRAWAEGKHSVTAARHLTSSIVDTPVRTNTVARPAPCPNWMSVSSRSPTMTLKRGRDVVGIDESRLVVGASKPDGGAVRCVRRASKWLTSWHSSL
jgi:hypothetical protein